MPFSYPVKKPDAASMASRLPEPLRKPGGMVLQGIMDLVGSDDPLSGAYPPMAAPMISIFKDAAGVPSRALRQAGTQEFLNTAKGLGNHAVGAAEWLAEKYPRVAAHIRTKPVEMAEKGRLHIPAGKVEGPMQMDFNTRIVSGADDARNTMAHEATHAAQALGNKHANELYQSAEDITGYNMNPFEIMARLRGAQAATGSYKAAPLPMAGQQMATTPRLLETLAIRHAGRPDERGYAASTIDEILKARRQGP